MRNSKSSNSQFLKFSNLPDYPPAPPVDGRELESHPIADQDPHEVAIHPIRNVCQHETTVFQPHAIQAARLLLNDDTDNVRHRARP